MWVKSTQQSKFLNSPQFHIRWSGVKNLWWKMKSETASSIINFRPTYLEHCVFLVFGDLIEYQINTMGVFLGLPRQIKWNLTIKRVKEQIINLISFTLGFIFTTHSTIGGWLVGRVVKLNVFQLPEMFFRGMFYWDGLWLEQT